ncbi:hypothetical protein F5B22DRAFT_356926 [Xylaria bambusicola]|uniref:uncharacterized protein n=1 Tax=Xylaria bambusicola TaxID=326684 RepID=UPI002007F82C|nr:uncharacterized protein F5B22DRAFT_356926 [Xylaria bambusicola]KAI0525709.1 hypothetical protein F5B22DRAFT_356926 [Xylaria bambusicola]
MSVMVSSIKEEARKPSQMTVTTIEPVPDSDKSRTLERQYEGSIPLTPTSAHTVSSFDVDIEAMKSAQCQDNPRASMCANRLHSDSRVWPGQAYWREKTRAAKRKNRSCQCLARLDKRIQIAVKITIVLVILGIAVAVGFGISKSLGARVWQPKDDQR